MFSFSPQNGLKQTLNTTICYMIFLSSDSFFDKFDFISWGQGKKIGINWVKQSSRGYREPIQMIIAFIFVIKIVIVFIVFIIFFIISIYLFITKYLHLQRKTANMKLLFEKEISRMNTRIYAKFVQIRFQCRWRFFGSSVLKFRAIAGNLLFFSTFLENGVVWKRSIWRWKPKVGGIRSETIP